MAENEFTPRTEIENPGGLKRLRSLSPAVSESGSRISDLSYCLSSCSNRRKSNKPLRIAIEGNIAAGKSTFISILEELALNNPNSHWFMQPEPLAKWQNDKKNGKNLLELFYTDPTRWAYTFEAYTFITRMQQALDAETEINKQMAEMDEADVATTITFFERSVYSSRLVFAENSFESGSLTNTEWALYCDWSNYLFQTVKQLKLDAIVYLKCDPEVCIERMKIRNRSEECDVPSDYLRALHEKYEYWLNGWMRHEQFDNDGNKMGDMYENSESFEETEMKVSKNEKIKENSEKTVNMEDGDNGIKTAHKMVKRALNDVPVLIIDCSKEFQTNAQNRENMLNQIRAFIHKLQFYDDDEDSTDFKFNENLNFVNEQPISLFSKKLQTNCILKEKNIPDLNEACSALEIKPDGDSSSQISAISKEKHSNDNIQIEIPDIFRKK